MSKKSIISLGLQRVFLIRQNIIALSVLLEQEAQSRHPVSSGVPGCITGFLMTTEKTELVFSLSSHYVVTCDSMMHLNCVVHHLTEMGES